MLGKIPKSTIRLMIIVNLNGGLGNQLFQYCLARRLLSTTNKQVKLDLHNYGENSYRKYSLNQFNIKVETASTTDLYKVLPFYYQNGFPTNVINKFFKKQLVTYYSYKELIKYENEYYKYDPSVFSINRNILLIGYWQNEKYFLDIRQQILEDIQLQPKPSDAYKFYLNKIKSSNSVSIHVRRGDFLTFKDYHVLSNEYYQKAFEYVGGQINNPAFFVFSDDINWAKNNLKSNNDMIFIEDCSSESEELLLMSACSAHINANSTFSWWGAWLGGDNNIVITPTNWFTDSRNMHDFIPDRWIRL